MKYGLVVVVFIYLLVVGLYSVMTPAWEPNDEADHTMYVEHIVKYRSLPSINIANGDESHQPPLYYIFVAEWQRILGLKYFRPSPILSTNPHSIGLSHKYTPALREDAIELHILRIPSILFGLGTVIFTYFAGRAIRFRKDIALASALVVALLPKEDVVSSVVTNDSLVIMLGSLAFLLMILWIRGSSKLKRRLVAFCLGVTFGAAILTKLNSLPLIGLFLVIMLLFSVKNKLKTDLLITIAGLLLTSGWWFYRNWHLYHDFLASKISNSYLANAIPGLIKPVSIFNAHRFLNFFPYTFLRSVWYDGWGNQLLLPLYLDIVLAVIAFISVVGMVRYVMKKDLKNSNVWVYSVLAAAVVAGIIATLIIVKDTTQAEARVAFIGLSAFAIIITVGTCNLLPKRLKRIGAWAWPSILLLVNIYVMLHFVYPLRSL